MIVRSEQIRPFRNRFKQPPGLPPSHGSRSSGRAWHKTLSRFQLTRSPGHSRIGLRHEAAYLASLTERGLSVADLRGFRNDETAAAETRARMEAGVDVIAQGTLAVGRWFGRPDLLRKVPKPSAFGDWSYEVYDCKLARETKATTILQLALYSDLLATVQGQAPEFMYVVPPAIEFAEEAHRIADYAAYFRHVKRALRNPAIEAKRDQRIPNRAPIVMSVAGTKSAMDAKSRRPSLARRGNLAIATESIRCVGCRQRGQSRGISDSTKQKPLHGSRESHERVREQARVQVDGRACSRAVHELLAIAENTGFCRLPAPSAEDMFVDLEGDPFVGICGQEYLFGFVASKDRA